MLTSKADFDRSDALHARARAFVNSSAESFDALACDLARFQADHTPGYARLCRARGIDLSSLDSASKIPAVPTDAFKLTRVATFDEAHAAVTFRTSGTTIGARGSHSMRDVSTYDAGAIAWGRHWLVRDQKDGTRIPVVVLHPAPSAAPDSSLGHMCDRFAHAFGEDVAKNKTWLIDDDGVFDMNAFDERVAVALTKNQPMLVLATSFALVHLLDALGDNVTFALPPGSRVMQTGGFKGKSREVSAAQLRSDLARAFAIPPSAIVSEYGMTELSSQFYERSLFDPPASHQPGLYAEPPWARVVPVDPESLDPVPDGEIGIAKIVDLLNVDSAVAVLTQDRVRRCRSSSTTTFDAFELLGRASGAPSRGCSIAIDELLARG